MPLSTHIQELVCVLLTTGYDLELLDWLETYTFPKEAGKLPD